MKTITLTDEQESLLLWCIQTADNEAATRLRGISAERIANCEWIRESAIRNVEFRSRIFELSQHIRPDINNIFEFSRESKRYRFLQSNFWK